MGPSVVQGSGCAHLRIRASGSRRCDAPGSFGCSTSDHYSACPQVVGPTTANELVDPTRKSISLKKCRTGFADGSGATNSAAPGRCAAKRLGHAPVDSHADGEFFSPHIAVHAYQYVIRFHFAFPYDWVLQSVERMKRNRQNCDQSRLCGFVSSGRRSARPLRGSLPGAWRRLSDSRGRGCQRSRCST